MGWLKKTIKRAEAGKIFGSSAYGRFASNATGTTTSARLIGRARHHERIEPNNVVDDARVMRPGQAWSNANNDILSEQQDAEEREAWMRQNGIENNVKGIRAQFGLFEGDPNADPAHAALAKQAAKDIGDSQDRYHQAYLNYFNPQLDDQYNDASRRATWAGVDRGNSGGSADQVRQRPILTRYVEGRQKVAAGADAGVSNLQDQEQAARIRLEGQARNGLAPEYAVRDELSSLGRGYDSANRAIAGDTLGDFFGAGAGINNSYQTGYGQQQGKQNAQRVSLFGDTGESGGRYT